MNTFRRILQSIIKSIFLLCEKCNLRYKYIKSDITIPNEPVLFLSNHHLNLDAVRLRAHNNRRIAFVVHEEVYRNKLYRWIGNNILDMICRGNSKRDISYIKKLFRAKAQGLSIGIYPEGGINYFNQSIPFDISLAKLAKKLDMPIVIVNINGGTFVKPRWAKYKGHNKVEYGYKRLITKDVLHQLSVEDLHQNLQNCLYVNDYDWQRKTLSKVNRRCPTLYLKRALFVCPECKTFHSLSFSNNAICCKSCHCVFGLDEYDFVTGSTQIKDLVAWDNLQYTELQNRLHLTNESEILLQTTAYYNESNLNQYFNNKTKVLSKITLTKNNLTITTPTQTKKYSTQDIFKIYVEFNNTLQFSYQDTKVRIFSPDLSAYIWTTFLRCVSGNIPEVLLKGK